MLAHILQPFDEFPEEGKLVGRILAAYSEIDLDICNCLATAIQNSGAALRALYRLRGEESRVQIADAIMRHHYYAAGLSNQYEAMMGAVRWCKSLRNQYAHCHWWAESGQGLFFTDLEKAAKTHIGTTTHRFVRVDVPLLTRQEAFLDYASAWLWYLRHELDVRAGRSTSHDWQAPQITEPPPLYNPPAEYPLRWSHWGDTGPIPEEPAPTPGA